MGVLLIFFLPTRKGRVYFPSSLIVRPHMLFTTIFILLSLFFFYYKGRTATFTPRTRTYKDLGYSTLTKEALTPSIPATSISLMSRDSKQNYLQSQAWQDLKAQRLLIANNKCEHCSSTSSLHLHHVHYANLGQENINDVRILCAHCHSLLHEYTGKDRLTMHHPILLQGLKPCHKSKQSFTETSETQSQCTQKFFLPTYKV